MIGGVLTSSLMLDLAKIFSGASQFHQVLIAPANIIRLSGHGGYSNNIKWEEQKGNALNVE